MASWGSNVCQCMDPRIAAMQNGGMSQSLYSFPLSRHTTTVHYDYSVENGLFATGVSPGLTSPPVVGRPNDIAVFEQSPFGSMYFYSAPSNLNAQGLN